MKLKRNQFAILFEKSYAVHPISQSSVPIPGEGLEAVKRILRLTGDPQYLIAADVIDAYCDIHKMTPFEREKMAQWIRREMQKRMKSVKTQG